MELYKEVLQKINASSVLFGQLRLKDETSSRDWWSNRPHLCSDDQDGLGRLSHRPTLDRHSVTGDSALATLKCSGATVERNIQIADFATAYKTGDFRSLPAEFTKGGPSRIRGVLDDRFEKGLRDWTSNHPLSPKKSWQILAFSVQSICLPA